jgi:hypothetical protein
MDPTNTVINRQRLSKYIPTAVNTQVIMANCCTPSLLCGPYDYQIFSMDYYFPPENLFL